MRYSIFTLKPIAAITLSALLLVSTAIISGCNDKENPSAKQAKAREYVERAENYRRQGQFRAAIIEARNALQQNPQDHDALLKLATIFNELGQGKSALKLLEPVAKDADRSEAIAIAQSYFLQHKYQSVLDYLAANEVRLNLSKDDEASLLKARALLRLNQLTEAREILSKLSPSNLAAHLELVRLLRQQGDVSGSQNELNLLLNKYPEDIEVLLEASAQAEQEGDFAQAEDLLSKALINLPTTDILVPQKAEVLQRLVTTLTKLGRSNEALIYSKTLADANPQGAVLQDKFKQGLELFQAGKLDEAEPILTEVFNESHNDSVGALLGMIRYAKNDLNGAANYLTTSIDPETAPESALATLAATQLRLSQPEKLLALFDAPARARIKNPELKTLVGIALLQTGSTHEGETLIQSAQAEQPQNAAIRATLARYFLASRQPEKAIETLETGLKFQADESLSQLLISAYANANKPDQALNTAKQLANVNPNKAESWWVLGRTALSLNKLEVAEPALRNALAKQASLLPAQLDLAQVHLLRKQPEQAEAIYRTVLKEHSDDIGALRGLIVSFMQRSPAVTDVDTQILSVANSDNARAALAEYHLRRREIDLAASALKPVSTESDSTYVARIRQQLAIASTASALQARDFDSARSQVLEALKNNPRDIEMMLLLARTEIGADKIEEARKIVAQLVQMAPQNPAVSELQGDMAIHDKQPAAAAAHYQKAWKKTGNDKIGNKLYHSLIGADKIAANKMLEQWQQQNPKSDIPQFLLGVQQQLANNIPAAIKAYETAIALNPKQAYALNNLAGLYQDGHDTRALATAERAYNLNPKDPAIMDTYGWLLIQNHQNQKGLQLLREASALAPSAKEIQQHLQEAQSGVQ